MSVTSSTIFKQYLILVRNSVLLATLNAVLRKRTRVGTLVARTIEASCFF